MTYKAIAIIPARGGSKRIPRKNLVSIGEKPLIVHSILSALKSRYLKNNVFVSTEDKEIAIVSKKYGAQIIERPKDLATDESTTLFALKHAVNYLEKNGVVFDTAVLLQPTSPFRRTETIDLGLEKLWNNWQQLDVIFSIRPAHHPYYWQLKIKNEILSFVLSNNFSKVRSQDFDKTYEIDGLLYVIKKDFLKKAKGYQFSKGRSSYMISNKIEAVEIDDDDDLSIARSLLKSKRLWKQ